MPYGQPLGTGPQGSPAFRGMVAADHAAGFQPSARDTNRGCGSGPDAVIWPRSAPEAGRAARRWRQGRFEAAPRARRPAAFWVQAGLNGGHLRRAWRGRGRR